MNDQLNPSNKKHLRNDPRVTQWIANRQEYEKHVPDCSKCGWPHSPVLLCGAGATFGELRLGGFRVHVDTSNVAYLVNFVGGFKDLGFHWRDEIFVASSAEKVIISHVEVFNGNPSMMQWKIPVNEFASIVCAGSVGGETSERYQEALNFLTATQGALK